MDEADYLGDRIAIMAKGKVQCCGSSLFLKSKYGVGYTFTVSKTQSADTNGLMNAITSHVPRAELLSNAGTEISYQLPLDAADTFPSMFDHLDHNGKPLGIESYGISVTTLEEVFLRVGHAADDHDKEEKKANELHEKASSSHSKAKDHLPIPVTIDIAGKDGMLPSQATPPPASFGRQVKALLIKRLQHQMRDRKSLMWQIGYPVLILLFGILLLKIAASTTDPAPLYLTPSQYDLPMAVPLGYPIDGVTDPTATAAFLNTLSTVETITPVAVATSNLTTFAQYLVDTALTSGNNRYGAIYVNGPSLSGSVPLVDEHYTIFVNTTGTHSLPVYFSMLSNARFQQMRTTLGLTSAKTPFITAANHQLPSTKNQKVLLDSISSLVIGIAFAFVPASVVGWIVKERQSKVKHLQIISGVTTMSYWVSTWLWDFISFMIPCALAMIIFAIYDLGTLIGSNSGATILSMILYSASITSFTYCLSFLFDNHASAQNVMLLLYIVTGAVMGIVVYILSIIPSTQSAGKALRYIFRFIPNYAFSEVMQNQMTRTSPLIFGHSRTLWDMDITGAPMLYLAIETIAYFGILLLIEKVLASPDMLAKFFSTPTLSEKDIANEAKMSAEEDEDIVAERKRVTEQLEQNGKASGGPLDMISVQGMRKVYNGRFGANAKCAVKNLHFGVPEGQCFGFLGKHP
jgi:ATP-binding cassette subfamily A (ABC1) protein 3